VVQLAGSALHCVGVRKSFGNVSAVADLSLTVAAGETLGIAGANGAGKTTLFNLIAGSLRPDAGEIRFGDARIDTMRPDQICRLGVVRTFQTTAVSPEQSVMENVALAAAYGRRVALRGLPRFTSEVIAHAHEALETVGLAGAEARLAGQLSVLDQRRLMLASALAAAPLLLMLDEPVGGLLPDEIDAMVGVLDEVRTTGVGLIVIEHVMSFLTRVCPERILVLHRGVRLFEGTAEQVGASEAVREAWLGDELVEAEPQGMAP
jgi:ABC-type branched-subunit amino acid transport system ATPase component